LLGRFLSEVSNKAQSSSFSKLKSITSVPAISAEQRASASKDKKLFLPILAIRRQGDPPKFYQ
jgi:hypothetical protein